jgi:glycosyltransferase involved in cell wall biosynthesis
MIKNLFFGTETIMSQQTNGGLARYKNEILRNLPYLLPTEVHIKKTLIELFRVDKNIENLIHVVEPWGLSNSPKVYLEKILSNNKLWITIPDVQDLAIPENFSEQVKRIRNDSYDLIKSCNANIITLSEFSKSEIMKYLQIQHEKIKVIGCGYDRNIHEIDSEINNVLNFLKSKFRLFYVPSKMWKHKGHEGLINEIFSRRKDLYERNIRIIFTGVTPTELKNVYPEKFLAELGKVAIILGNVSDSVVTKIFHLMDGLIFPSTYEGLGMPVGEAGYIGKPIFAFDIETNIEILGLDYPLTQKLNFKGLIDSVCSFINDGSKLLNEAEKSKLKLIESTWENITKRIIREYKVS